MAYSVLSSNSQRAGRVNVLRDAMAVDTLDACGVYLGTTGGQVYGSADAASTRRQSAGGGMRVLDASAAQHVHDRVVPLVAGKLERWPAGHPPPRLVRGQREADGPRLGEADRVGDRRFVVDRFGIDSREPLDHVQVRGRSAPDVPESVWRPIGKVVALDHQRIPFPPSARLTVPLHDAGLGAAVDRDDPALTVHLVHHHVGWRLKDLVVRVVAEPDLRLSITEAPLARVEVDV